MSQKKVHFVRLMMYDPQAQAFWGVLSVANFRGAGDEENMSLGSINGKYARQKPKDLLTHLEGLVSILSVPTAESLQAAAQQLQDATPESTQDLLSALAQTTQTTTKPSGPSTPDSIGSNRTHKSTGGKAPRVQPPTQVYAGKVVDVTDDDTSSDEGDSSGSEGLQSGQPERKSPPVPVKPIKPGGKLVQTKLQAASLTSSKKRKLEHIVTTDEEDATVIRFAGGNLSKEALNKIVEKAFMEKMAETEAEQEGGPTKRAKKGPAKTGKVSPAFTKAGKPSSAATTEQKGTPLFMNGPYTFL